MEKDSCPECGSTETIYDYRTRETICRKCGLVIRVGREIITTFKPLPSNLHYLVASNPEDSVRPFFSETKVLENRMVKELPPRPLSLVVRVGTNVTYKTVGGNPAWCEYHKALETVKSRVERSREYTSEEYDVFKSLVRKRGSGYTTREGVLAYLVACLRGTKSFISGFLWASEFSLFKTASTGTVGQALSRIQDLGIMPPEFGGYWRVAEREPSKIDLKYGTLSLVYSYVPVNYVLREKEYVVRREAAERIRQSVFWWKILDAKPQEIPGQLGLEKWF